jgi:hypothetical protein
MEQVPSLALNSVAITSAEAAQFSVQERCLHRGSRGRAASVVGDLPSRRCWLASGLLGHLATALSLSLSLSLR